MRLLAPAALALIAAAPQEAQTVPGVGNFSLPPSRPTATPSPLPTPAAPVLVLPTPTPSPSPTPRAAPRPAATPTPRRIAAPPQPASAPAPIASPTPTPTVSPLIAAPAAPVVVTPSPLPTATATPSAPADRPSAWLILALLGAGAAIVAAMLLWRRRRATDTPRPVLVKAPAPVKRPAPRVPRSPPPPESPPPAPEPEAPRFWTPSVPAKLPDPVVAAPPPPPSRARIEIEIAPRRAGLNLLSATAEIEVILRNEGDAAATGVAIDVRLLNAQAGQDPDLGALFAAATGRPAVPPFAIEAGETRNIRAVATLPRGAITPMNAGGREIFVPLITVDARYNMGDGARGQTAAAFAIGRTGATGDKLKPFRLDAPSKMFDEIAVRPHSFSVKT